MAKKKKQQKSVKKNNSAAAKPINWKKWIKNSVISLSFISVFIAFFAAYGHIVKVESDLSVIGNGKPTVVQIHDPNCQLCLRLKNNVDAVKGEFKEKVQFKTVNIQTRKGNQFAARHSVSHVTLLFFNQSGKRINTLQGVSSEEEIRAALSNLKY